MTPSLTHKWQYSVKLDFLQLQCIVNDVSSIVYAENDKSFLLVTITYLLYEYDTCSVGEDTWISYTLCFSFSGLFRYDIEVILVKDFYAILFFVSYWNISCKNKFTTFWYGCVPAYYNSMTWCTKAITKKTTIKPQPLIVTHAFILYIKTRRHVCTYTYICTQMFTNITEENCKNKQIQTTAKLKPSTST